MTAWTGMRCRQRRGFTCSLPPRSKWSKVSRALELLRTGLERANWQWIDVRWDVMDTAFQGMAAGLGDQFQSAQAFITGSLPSAGMASLGLYTGFRRK